MKIFRKKDRKKFLVWALVLLLFTLISTFSILEASEAECERAYLKCMVTAGLLAIGSRIAGASWAAFCTVGYAWCLEFM